MNSPDFVNYIMLTVSTGYMIYYIVKIKLTEKKDIQLIDEEFLLEKKKKK